MTTGVGTVWRPSSVHPQGISRRAHLACRKQTMRNTTGLLSSFAYWSWS